MKKCIFLFLLFLAASVQLSAANSFQESLEDMQVVAASFTAAAELPADPADLKPLACFIMTVSACGGSVSSQYCTGGSHGTYDEWEDYLTTELCNRAEP